MERVFHSSIWLYGNLTWHNIGALKTYPKPADLCYSFPVALALLIVRCLCERMMFIPLGQLLGLKRKAFLLKPNKILEAAYVKKLVKSDVQRLAAQVQWTTNEVDIWFRRRKSMDKSSQLKKFSECIWRFVFYLFVAVYATSFLYEKSWFWDTSLIFEKSPVQQTLTNDIWWYYMLELGFYVSLMMSQFTDVKRKDYKMMMLHHGCTLILFSGTWCTNSVRIGTFVAYIHDFSDIPLEAAKCLKYLRMEKASTFFSLVFIFTWFITRLGIFPYVIMVSWRDAYPYVSRLPYLVLNSFLVALLSLHLIWTWMILQALRNVFHTKSAFADVRSDSEEETATNDDKTT